MPSVKVGIASSLCFTWRNAVMHAKEKSAKTSFSAFLSAAPPTKNLLLSIIYIPLWQKISVNLSFL